MYKFICLQPTYEQSITIACDFDEPIYNKSWTAYIKADKSYTITDTYLVKIEFSYKLTKYYIKTIEHVPDVSHAIKVFENSLHTRTRCINLRPEWIEIEEIIQDKTIQTNLLNGFKKTFIQNLGV
jgi:hypothetical protein